ncbi:glycosyltransferase [Bacteroides thetaiotaomicron]|jgi:glycosyltransferase involved in cell wall biosynthesis|uniref:glycosyltransferase n=2 Tax=Bacteroides thetaiotaomicron TaxID=818 RepID=UPI000EF106EF|nr:glycosyltransferase [Bacteroides thetaiotaomicron]MDC2260493.1 glycosyltransferase [Bacteroides thetaiotaomicron]MDC2265061.1 glycosyltransferase [Bacteroides thetaiotaomicron]RGO87086.1 glycosyltransferase [Bacteroides thetaiotaomicron]
MEKIAVILPVYKNDKVPYVHLSIDSILNQTYKGKVTLYVGVDGSVDRDLCACLNEYESKGVKVRWFNENRGLAIVLNDLLDIVRKDGYEYIARMDADDISMLDRLEKQMTYLLAHPEIDVVGGAITEIDEEGKSRNKTIIYPKGPKECYDFFAIRNPHAHSAVLFRWKFFEKAACKYRPEYRQNQDTMLWVDGMRKGTKHANIPDVVLRFRFTNSLFKKRRNGWDFAKKQLADRNMINKILGYGFGATALGYMMFIMLVSPAWVKKIAYKVLR